MIFVGIPGCILHKSFVKFEVVILKEHLAIVVITSVYLSLHPGQVISGLVMFLGNL